MSATDSNQPQRKRDFEDFSGGWADVCSSLPTWGGSFADGCSSTEGFSDNGSRKRRCDRLQLQDDLDIAFGGFYAAQDDLDTAQDDLGTNDGLDTTQNGLDTAQADTTQDGLDNAQDGLDNAQGGLENAQDYIDTDVVDTTQNSLDTAQVDTTQDGLDNAQDDLRNDDLDIDDLDTDESDTDALDTTHEGPACANERCRLAKKSLRSTRSESKYIGPLYLKALCRAKRFKRNSNRAIKESMRLKAEASMTAVEINAFELERCDLVERVIITREKATEANKRAEKLEEDMSQLAKRHEDDMAQLAQRHKDVMARLTRRHGDDAAKLAEHYADLVTEHSKSYTECQLQLQKNQAFSDRMTGELRKVSSEKQAATERIAKLESELSELKYESFLSEQRECKNRSCIRMLMDRADELGAPMLAMAGRDAVVPELTTAARQKVQNLIGPIDNPAQKFAAITALQERSWALHAERVALEDKLEELQNQE